VKHRRAPAFVRDLDRLSPEELDLFRQVVRERFIPAAERIAASPAAKWPRSLRVKRMSGHPRVWEMTWSFAGPDGRATFEWVTVEDEPAIRWRRVGGHEIFGSP
jgi:hypothetical protein